MSLTHSFCARTLPHTLHTPLIIISSHDDTLSNGVEITCAHAKALWLGRTVNMPQPRQPKRNLPSACPVKPSRASLSTHTHSHTRPRSGPISPARHMHTRDHGQTTPVTGHRHAYTGTSAQTLVLPAGGTGGLLQALPELAAAQLAGPPARGRVLLRQPVHQSLVLAINVAHQCRHQFLSHSPQGCAARRIRRVRRVTLGLQANRGQYSLDCARLLG